MPDPYNGQSFNRYSYVNNSPLSYTDPSGFDRVGFDLRLCDGDCFFPATFVDPHDHLQNSDYTVVPNAGIATGAQIATTMIASEGIGAEIERNRLNAEIKRLDLDPDDRAARSLAKQLSRLRTPPIVRGSIMIVRPSVEPLPGSGGTANRTSEGANRLARNLGRVGRVSAVGGTVLGGARIATADNPTREALIVSGEVAGSGLGAWLGGAAGCLAGPFGCIGGALLGGVGGGSLGGAGGEAIYGEATQDQLSGGGGW